MMLPENWQFRLLCSILRSQKRFASFKTSSWFMELKHADKTCRLCDPNCNLFLRDRHSWWDYTNLNNHWLYFRTENVKSFIFKVLGLFYVSQPIQASIFLWEVKNWSHERESLKMPKAWKENIEKQQRKIFWCCINYGHGTGLTKHMEVDWDCKHITQTENQKYSFQINACKQKIIIRFNTFR